MSRRVALMFADQEWHIEKEFSCLALLLDQRLSAQSAANVISSVPRAAVVKNHLKLK
jgi:hypothetical protein